MIRLIGFEGRMGDALITYGAAAIEMSDGTVINSFTRFKQARADLDDSEALTKFKKPWELHDDSLSAHPLVVVAVRRDESPPYVEDLYPDRGKLGGYLDSKREKPFAYFLLRNRESLEFYAEEVAARSSDIVLKEVWSGADALGLLRCALTLSPRDPVLHALRVHLSADRLSALRTANRLLETESEEVRDRFELMLNACERPSSSETLYLFKYEEGDQQLGGMDLNAAVSQLTAFDAVHSKLVPLVRKRLPFLDEEDAFPDMRLQQLRAASAEFGFGVLGKNLGERVIRSIELDLVAELFRGAFPSEYLRHDQDFAQELRRILNPPGGATLRHQPIGATELEPVIVEFPDEDRRVVDELTLHVLGFVEGFYSEVRRAEIRLAPNHMERVSTTDDGFGHAPVGAEILRAGGGTFEPAVFALLRRKLASRRIVWHLQKLSPLEPSKRYGLNTLPSSIVPKGMFSTGYKYSVWTDGEVISIGHIGSIVLPTYGRTIDGARLLMTEWGNKTRLEELRASRIASSKWYPSFSFDVGSLSSLMRVLLVFDAETEDIPVDQLVQSINARFGVRVRKNNTWRVIRDNAEMFELHEDLVGLSLLGRGWSRVLHRFYAARG